jgi:hypothetical protein
MHPAGKNRLVHVHFNGIKVDLNAMVIHDYQRIKQKNKTKLGSVSLS